jgi:hypothetical protein
MSEIKVNKLSPRSGTTVTLGDSGDTFTIPSGATINNQGTATNFGATGSASWVTTVKTSTFTAVAGEGYFINTTGGAVTVNLPAGTAGAVVAIKDYAGTFDTNAVTLVQNGSDKIGGSTVNATLDVEGIAVTLVFIDSTQGWLVTDSGLQTEAPTASYITATGGTITTVCTNFKVHTFTGPGTFTVCTAGNAAGSNSVDYLIVAGGGGGAGAVDNGSGAGAGGGFRTSASTYSGPPLAVACGVIVTAQGYPIVVGGGGPGGPGGLNSGTIGVSSSALSLTSTGGGFGSRYNIAGGNGGSGGGAGENSTTGGSGNTPPVSPPQGNNGGASAGCVAPGPGRGTGGGGGASEAGVTGAPTVSGRGGAGAPNAITGSAVNYAGGGGGGIYCGTTGAASPCGTGGAGKPIPATDPNHGTTNRGGGGGGSGGQGAGTCVAGGNGGSGIVIIRYKFQN